MAIRCIAVGLILATSLSSPAVAQNPSMNASNTFAFGFDARSLGMGNASVALAEDFSSAYWNPAGMTQVRMASFGAMHANKFGLGIQYTSFGGAGGLRWSPRPRLTVHAAAGASYIINSLGGIETFGPGGESTGTISDRESQFTGSLAGGVVLGPVEISVAQGRTGYFHSLAGESATAWNTTSGFYLQLFDVASIGYALSNPGGTGIQWTTGAQDSIPQIVRTGAAFHILNDAVTISIQRDLPRSDFLFAPNDQVFADHWGVELTPLKLLPGLRFPADVSFRTGSTISDGEAAPRYGLGIGLFGWLSLDLAFVVNRTLGDSLVVGLQADF